MNLKSQIVGCNQIEALCKAIANLMPLSIVTKIATFVREYLI
ncbi:MAG: hypothetical protein RMY62_007465 [Nostoc sp. ZfuVER08]|nr:MULTISPECIES: hypothetical protein [Nostoc]MDZ8010796.1 hypothetical protein [Nostoc sp. ZfuVER08]